MFYLVRLGFVRAVSDRDLLLDRHPASARRRQGLGQRIRARADRLPRTHIRLPRRAFSRRTARSMVGAFARPCRFRCLERAALALPRASYFAFGSCALSA